MNTKNSSKCHAKHPENSGSICKREIWDHDNGLCIFHAKEKPSEEFKKYFLAELKLVNSNKEIEYFDGRAFQFPTGINFKNITFEKIADFSFSNFGNNISFKSAYFKNNVSFMNAKFGDKALFKEAVFEKKASFLQAKFGENAHFGKATFGENALFLEAKFSHGVYFGEAKFGDNAHFGRATFGNEASFVKSSFGDEITFQNATFGSKADFRKVFFGNKVTFKETTFEYGATFDKASFSGEVIFDTVTLTKNISFFNTCFLGETLFRNIKIHKPEFVNFNECKFQRYNRIRFNEIDLRYFSFVQCDIENVEFLRCTWHSYKNRKNLIYDEFLRSNIVDIKDNPNPTLEEIEQVYLRLQKNYEERKYEGAGDFYIGAMEMRRLQIAQNSSSVWKWLRQNLFSLTALYKIVSLYGERYFKTIKWMFILWLFFSFLFLFNGFRYSQSDPSKDKENMYINYDFRALPDIDTFIRDTPKALYISFNILTFQRNSHYILTEVSTIFAVFESMFSASLIALFLLAIRRKYKR